MEDVFASQDLQKASHVAMVTTQLQVFIEFTDLHKIGRHAAKLGMGEREGGREGGREVF